MLHMSQGTCCRCWPHVTGHMSQAPATCCRVHVAYMQGTCHNVTCHMYAGGYLLHAYCMHVACMSNACAGTCYMHVACMSHACAGTCYMHVACTCVGTYYMHIMSRQERDSEQYQDAELLVADSDKSTASCGWTSKVLGTIITSPHIPPHILKQLITH